MIEDIRCFQENFLRGDFARKNEGKDSKHRFFWKGDPTSLESAELMLAEKWIGDAISV